jgi:hypothetical protein
MSFAKPKKKTIDGVSWVTITQIEDPPRRIEWACGQWGSVRVMKGDGDESWCITYIHRVESSGYATADEAIAEANGLVREVAARRVQDAKNRGAKKAQIRELEKRQKAVAAPA